MCSLACVCACVRCRWNVLNPASMKQALLEGAVRLAGLNLYEQVGGCWGWWTSDGGAGGMGRREVVHKQGP